MSASYSIWSSQEIASGIDFECLTDLITDPTVPWKQITGQAGYLYERAKYIADGFRHGTWIRVIFEPNGRGILTAFPLDARDGERFAFPPK
jgi:hypothetical protein